MLKQCPICGKNYKGRNKNACSMACYAVYKSNKKSCAVCGKQFFSPPSADTVTCSPECSAKNRQSPELISKNIQALAKAQAIRPFHPLTGKFETNANAKNGKYNRRTAAFTNAGILKIGCVNTRNCSMVRWRRHGTA
jgi:predicted nucleic acid-binding Zn ribbon protein